jgi:hypothetical protein
MDALGLERVEEAFHRGIVVAVGLAAHRSADSVGGNGCAMVMCSLWGRIQSIVATLPA